MKSVIIKGAKVKLKSLIASTKTYLVLLVLAIGLLFYTFTVGYKQIKRLHETGEMVSHTFEVQRTIVEISSKFLEIEALQLKSLFENDKNNFSGLVITELGQSLERLRVLTSDNATQQERIEILKILRDDMVLELNCVINTDDIKAIDSAKTRIFNTRYEHINRISNIVDEAQEIKERMLSEESFLMISRKEEYTSQSYLTPLSSLLVALTSLGIFIIGFISIYQQKGEIEQVNIEVFNKNKKLKETDAFLKSVYKSSNSVISHFEPILDEKGEIKDFQFRYTSDAIEQVTGIKQNEVIGESLLKIYPMVFENGLFALMKKCFLSGETQDHESKYVFDNQEKYIQITIVKSDTGITNTAWETTKIKEGEKILQKLNDDLSLQNTIFKEAENVAGVGSFIWYLDNGTATVSDNFYRILDVEPNGFEVTFDSYKQYVHPEDVHIFNSLTSNKTEKGVSTLFTYRIMTKNNAIKYLDLKGRYVKIDNRPVSVGIVQDITSRVEKDHELLSSYEKLKLSNEELESFNRVASHDLQEPLRKIQMFISRIEDEGDNNLPNEVEGYFNKIKSATFRMRELIQNLLSYSKIDKVNLKFERIALNETMGKVEGELSQLIKESGTVISYDTLPVINGIPFKIEQLITNLISNSIKYRKAGIPPLVDISSIRLRNSEISENFVKNSKYYYRISFIDNGIGFDHKSASKIFEVFQRLHSKTEYTGTGIGLSICKKIVENHNGHIHAVGKKNEGSTFVVYLPADE